MFKLLTPYFKRYKGLVFWNVLFVVAQTVLQTFFLMTEMKTIIDKGVNMSDFSVIYTSGLKMIFFTVLIGLCSIGASYYSARVVAGITCDVRKDCYNKVAELSPQDFSAFGGSTLLTRTMGDGYQIQLLLIQILRNSLMIPLVLICMLILIFTINRSLFWILFFMFLLTIGLLVFFGLRSTKSFNRLQSSIDRLNTLASEKISGVRAIRAFNNEEFEKAKTQQANEQAYNMSIEANRKINFLAPLAMVLMNWTLVLIYLIGSYEVRIQMASISDLLLIFQYMGYIIGSLALVPVLVNLLPKVAVSSARINELLNYDVKKYSRRESSEETVPEKKGAIEFEDVIFGYSGANNVIANASFKAEAGKTTAIIGTTGSGKTTLLNLLLGLYKMNFGDIKIDGVSIREMDEKDLRKRIAYATQRPLIFRDTARNNLTVYDDDIDEAIIELASRNAAFDEVIEKMPNGLETEMAYGGMNISGGQRQRLSLARTIAKDADIYLFDDTFSALDANTEKLVRGLIKDQLKDKTIIMVAQKISTIKDADNIIVMDNGKIVGQGKHEDLLKNNKEYQDIYATQFYLEEGTQNG